MSADLRLGLVGCGQVARLGYLPALRRVRGFHLTAIADPVLSRCRDVAPTVTAYPDARSMIAAGVVDAIVLATPVATHLADAVQATAAGLPTLVEKPPAVNADEAAALARLNPVPFVGFNRRFDPLLQQLRARVPATGPVSLSVDLHYAAGSWRPYAVDDDVLLSVGTHLIDLVRWLTASEVRRVRARFLTSTRAVIELHGDRGTAYVSCATDRAPRDAITINGDDGRVIARHDGVGFSSKVAALWMMMSDKRLRRLIHPVSRTLLVRLLIQELEAFAAAARTPRTGMTPLTPLATAADGVAVMAVVDAARRSAVEDGSWQSVASVTLDQPGAFAVAAR
jgi:myo-inositol 2-dehydrogenase / D-chiro-inositol 1-dehydrogenase